MTKATFSGSVWASFLVGLLVGLVLLGAAPGDALAAGKRRVGVDVSGSPAGPIRAAISKVLKHHAFGVASADVSGDSADAIASAAKKGKLAAVIVGEVRDGGKRAKLRVYAADGDLIGEGSWTDHHGAKKLAKAIGRTLWARVGGALSKVKAGDADERSAKASPKAEKAEKPEPPEEKSAEPEDKSTSSRSEETASKSEADADENAGAARKSKSRRPKKKQDEDADEVDGAGATAALTALDLGVGPRFIRRTLTWANTNVTGYDMPLSPAIGLTLAWYPVAHFHGGWASNLGLAASAEFLPSYKSTTKSDGKAYPTPENDYWAGIRGRMPLGPVEGALTLGGGQHAFVFRSGGGSDRSTLATLPDVAYTYARVGLDFRIALPANLSAVVGGGYRYVLDGGKTNYLLQGPSFFPDAKITGLDVTAGLGYRVLPFLEARGGFDLRRYSIATHASGAQPAVPSGTDQTIALWIQAVFVLDGATGTGAAPARKAPPSEDEEPANDEKAESNKPGRKDDEE
ncbi:MAG: hypothetical protein JWM82_3781 [Myxococcales bacterium]|nr:hypothetical protein [Myxococcales bacterium]